jgi:radical SAM family uncharacterized protein
MTISSSEIRKRLDRILLSVQKPGRYVGGELNQVVKEWDTVKTHVCLVFPDIYDIGIPNLGLAILYDILNKQQDILAERAFSPWIDMEIAMRTNGIPLFSLESKQALSKFDIIGFSLAYESLYTNVLNILDMAGLPLLSSERTSAHPLVIAGGHATYNPEPMAAFIDAFVIGEGEEVILEIVAAFQNWRNHGESRLELLRMLANIPGVYVPSLYQVTYFKDGRISNFKRLDDRAPSVIIKRILPVLPEPLTHFIVPSIEVVHDRVAIEIMRGCSRGCRFCQAGMIGRPVRERPVDEIISAIEAALESTGYEEVALLSLSSSDYSRILDLVDTVHQRFSSQHLSISLPSLRIESFSVELMDRLKETRPSGGFTLAPEAASERMRQIINKPVSTPQLLETARSVYEHGWTSLKLYFMIGHPSETLEDIQAIIDLCKAVLAEGNKVIMKKARVHVGVSTFVPKAHTPFQWAACDTVEHINTKLAMLKHGLRSPGIKLTWNEPEMTLLEAWLARGDRRISDVIYRAWQKGAKFDAWQDQFHFSTWIDAFDAAGIDPVFYSYRWREPDEILPWDHINAGVRKSFLAIEFKNSQQGITSVDCREKCHACGILPMMSDLRRNSAGSIWKCPENTKKFHAAPIKQLQGK